MLLLGYSRKNPNMGGYWGYTFLNPPWNYSICNFTHRNSRGSKFLPLTILQNCVTTFANSKVESKDPWKFHIIFFLSTPGNSTSFSIDWWNFHILSLQYSWKFHVLNTRCLNSFWNSPFDPSLKTAKYKKCPQKKFE